MAVWALLGYCAKNVGGSYPAAIQRHLGGCVDVVVMEVFHPMHQKERAALSVRPSRVAHVSAHHCRSPVGLIPHHLVSYRTARTALLKNILLRYGGVFLGCRRGDAFGGVLNDGVSD